MASIIINWPGLVKLNDPAGELSANYAQLEIQEKPTAHDGGQDNRASKGVQSLAFIYYI